MKRAFTMAEVLITIGIIGVVAAMTMPIVIGKYQEHEIKVKAKKTYSMLMQVLDLAQAKYGTIGDNSTLFQSATTNDELVKNFSEYLPGGFVCYSDADADSKCQELKYKYLYQSYNNKYGQFTLPAIILPDGGVVCPVLSSNRCKPTETSGVTLDSEGNPKYDKDGNLVMWHSVRDDCGSIYFDVNGAKEPNKAGFDIFQFTVWPDHIGPAYWNIYGYSSLASILSGGKLIFNRR